MAHPHFVVNEKGETTHVLLPIREFKRLKALDKPANATPKSERLARVKAEMRNELEEAFAYVADAQAGRVPKPTTTLRDLIRELESENN
jgi:hypothetical protein